MSLPDLLWRPKIPLSIDGEPLTVSISDFFATFPYHRLITTSTTTTTNPDENSSLNIITSFFLKPTTPIVLIVIYILSEKVILPKICKALDIKGRSILWKCIFALHNFGLFAFSFIVWINSLVSHYCIIILILPYYWFMFVIAECSNEIFHYDICLYKLIVIQHMFTDGIVTTIIDEDGYLWSSGLGGWAFIFYLSKYYEFVDTFVLIIKNKKPSFLQVYHHCGVVLTMYGAITSQAGWVSLPVVMNSGIHTLMYFYFFVKTLYPKVEIKQAKFLTSLQILQFLVGIVMGTGLIVGEHDSPASRFALASLAVYGVGLVILFSVFAKKKYKKKEKNQ